MNISALIAGLLAGVIGAMGLGGGAVLIMYLSLLADIPQLKAQGINLIFFLPIALVAVSVYAFKKQIKWRTVLPLAAGGMLGAVLGVFLADILGTALTSKLFGAALLFFGLKEIFSKVEKTTCKKR
ncbi:MAG: sulfite exporter TauE/SafE family protein [Clostridia bacterium]|nr:sulfite exporter TauE/SafE family protein [Clostridia bacterium]